MPRFARRPSRSLLGARLCPAHDPAPGKGLDIDLHLFGGLLHRNQRREYRPREPVRIAADNLQKTLDKEVPTSAEIKAKLAALRGAREKNKQQLVIAQQKLKEVLTIKQEALLVMTGMLE